MILANRLQICVKLPVSMVTDGSGKDDTTSRHTDIRQWTRCMSSEGSKHDLKKTKGDSF